MPGERNKVFIVNGRHAAAFEAVCELLVALGVEPVTWRQAVIATKKNNPNFSQILQKGFEMSAAVLVLLTPDEDTVLRTELRKPSDTGDRNKTGPVAQPRPNVLYELGYSMHRSKKKTIVILFEGCRVPSDMYGQHTIELIPRRIEHAVSEIQAALAHAEIVITPLLEEQIAARCPKLNNLSARSFESRDYIRAGTAVRSSEFAFSEMLDGQCDDLVIIGTNFGDQFGSRERPVSTLFQQLKSQLITRLSARVTLVFAPPKNLEEQSKKALDHLRDFSLPRLCDLYDDPELDHHHRSRLRIIAHSGAMYFQAFVRDPLDEARATLVATPRWPGDSSGPGRFFFAVRRKEHPAMFDALYSHIPSDLELGGAVSFEKVAEELGVRRRVSG